jgi:hypothetical protein
MSDKESTLFYKRNGYYIEKDAHVKQSLNTDVILADIDKVICQQIHRLTGEFPLPTHDPEVLHTRLERLLTLDKEAYIASLKLSANLFSVHSLLTASVIVDTVRSLGITLPLIQTTPVLHVMARNLKIPGGYHGIGVHQDWPSLQGSLDTVIIWIPLMTVNKNNYPVELIPGSHLGGLYPGTIAEQLYETDPNCYQEKDFIPMELDCGDILYMSSFLLHRTMQVAGSGLRIACSNRFENASEATYVRRVYPHAQKRVVNRDLIHLDFPQASEVKEVYES